ncbi:MAG: EutN/CcmL family microcompartment protein [Planctomycetia bacterium]
MFLARVVGHVVSTHKVASMVGWKLLAVEPLRVDPAGKSDLVGVGRTFIAVDLVGCGEGDVVLIVQGSSARMTEETKPLPIDAAVIGLVNEVSAYGNQVYSNRSVGSDAAAERE